MTTILQYFSTKWTFVFQTGSYNDFDFQTSGAFFSGILYLQRELEGILINIKHSGFRDIVRQVPLRYVLPSFATGKSVPAAQELAGLAKVYGYNSLLAWPFAIHLQCTNVFVRTYWIFTTYSDENRWLVNTQEEDVQSNQCDCIQIPPEKQKRWKRK